MTKKRQGEKMTEPTQPVCYIRVGEYYASYYKTKYGGEPIVFPEEEQLNMIVEDNICRNPDLKLLTKHSFSWLAYHYDREGQIFDIEVATPDPEERGKFIEVQIPEFVYRRGKKIATSSNWQLSKAGAERFRKQIKKEFWSDCREFIKLCKEHAESNGESVTLEACISDFMLMYDIPMSHFDNMLRSEQRVRSQIPLGSSKKRNLIEEKTGNVFIYT